MLFPNRKSILPSGGKSVSTFSLKGNFWHFEIANTRSPIFILAIKQDIKYWGTVSRNLVTTPGVSQLLFFSSLLVPQLEIFLIKYFFFKKKKNYILFPIGFQGNIYLS